MGNKEKTAVTLEKYLAILPENIHIPGDVSEAMRFEFVDSATSHLERLGQEIAAFEAGQNQQDDFVTTARTILHNIKGEAGIMDIAEISDVCRLTESLLDEDYGTVAVDTLLSVKAWLSDALKERALNANKSGVKFAAEKSISPDDDGNEIIDDFNEFNS